MREFCLGRGRDRHDAVLASVERVDHPADRPALARGIHAFEGNYERPLAEALAARKQREAALLSGEIFLVLVAFEVRSLLMR